MKTITPAKVANAKKVTASAEKKEKGSGSSNKKLVQARLPFKTITPTSTDKTGTAVNDKELKAEQLRKRKLSYDSENEAESKIERKNKQKTVTANAAAAATSSISTLCATKKKRLCESEEETIYIEDDDEPMEDDDEPAETVTKAKTPKENCKSANSAGTPKTEVATVVKKTLKVTPKSAGKKTNVASTKSNSGKKTFLAETPTSSTVQIKLPLKKRGKRKKSLQAAESKDAQNTMQRKEENGEVLSDSSDDIEFVAEILNPQKRTKITSTNETDEEQEGVGVDKETIKNNENKENTEPIIEVNDNKTDTAVSSDKNISLPNDAESIVNKEKVSEENSNNDAAIAQNPEMENKSAKADVIAPTTSSGDGENAHVGESTAKVQNNNDEISEIVSLTNDSDIESSNMKSSQSNMSTSFKDYSSSMISCDCDYTDFKSSMETDRSSKPKNDIVVASLSGCSSAGSSDEEDDADKTLLSKTAESDALLANSDFCGDSGAMKKLTPKQLKLSERRRKAREEKERKLQEERLEKQRAKEERGKELKRIREQKEEERRKEREDKEEQKRKEREEKEEQKRKEREDKERKRLAEIEAKTEEKRKRNEIKEEEIRKKEEERKRKEQEKEEAKQKKQKAAEAFTKFFVPRNNQAKVLNAEPVAALAGQIDLKNETDNQCLAFRPFQIKIDMKLAPTSRRTLDAAERKHLDGLMHFKTASSEDDDEELFPKKPLKRAELYLGELCSGKRQPHKWQRLSNDAQIEQIHDNDGDDCQIIDELDQLAEGIVEETHPPVERYRSKFYSFEENIRPPYRGTWRKKSKVIKPRKPFAQDTQYFDYEVDSDLEWEEEEPGESLHGSDDEKDKDGEDDDYDIDNEWFVPHGHLSDEELQNEEELCGDGGESNNREAQQAKLKILQQEFAQEMKKKTEKLKPRLIGCVWLDENGNKPELCPKVIWDALDTRAIICMNSPLLLEEPDVVEKPESNSPGNNSAAVEKVEKLRPIELTNEMQQNLVRLVHGNKNSKAFLVSEFIAHIEATDPSIKNGDARAPTKTAVLKKIDEFAKWKVMQIVRKKNTKNKPKKYLCWVCNENVLKQMQQSDLTLNNTWKYILQPKCYAVATDANEESTEESNASANSALTTETQESNAIGTVSAEKKKHKRKNLPITKFTKKLKQTEENESESEQTSVTSTSAASAASMFKKRVQLTTIATNLRKCTQPTLMEVDEVIELH